MIFNDVICRTAETGSIAPDKNEIAARLGVPRGYQNNAIDRCLEELQRSAVYKYAYARLPLRLQDGICDLDFAKVRSRDLYANLSKGAGCREIVVMAVTLGAGVDRLLARCAAQGQSKHFIMGALSSAAAEALCDYAQSCICASECCHPRYSPGYGDLSIELQAPLLERLNAGRLLGITLNGAFLMSPVKSVTAIIGLE